MAKNFANIYNDTGDSIALEQKFFLKEEVTRGTFVAPVGADFIFTLSGGTINFTRPIESSPHRSGRHHTTPIKKKTSTEWTIPTFFNIDTAPGAAIFSEIDPGMRVLHNSMFGFQDLAAGAQYTTATVPNTTFTLLENGDKWAIQAVGAFVEAANMTFPGDGESQTEWTGMAKTAVHIGVAKTTADNTGLNTITVEAGEGARFKATGKIMMVELDGLTRSADTPDGSPRDIVSISGDVLTIDGAVLADANGTLADIFVTYYEPENPVAINEPAVGLVGSVTIAGFTALDCIRSATINCTNNHELQDNCFGETGLGGSLFIAGGRFTAEVSLEINMNETMLELINTIRDDLTGEDIELILGDVAGRHLDIDLDKVIFSVPEVSVPDTGPIPITITGNAYQSGIDAFDEISVHYK
jgi:hypothetical protein